MSNPVLTRTTLIGENMDLSEVKHLPKVDHTPAELDEPSKLLMKAADLIAERGHCKRRRFDGVGYCVMGALGEVGNGGVNKGNGNTPNVQEAARRLDFSISRDGRISSHPGAGAVEWNNAEERTKDEVVAKLRAVALGL